MELYVPRRALAHVADRHVELGQTLVVFLHYHERTSHRRALRTHLLKRGLANPPREVVARREHDDEQQIGHGSHDLGYRLDVHGPYIPGLGTSSNISLSAPQSGHFSGNSPSMRKPQFVHAQFSGSASPCRFRSSSAIRILLVIRSHYGTRMNGELRMMNYELASFTDKFQTLDS